MKRRTYALLVLAFCLIVGLQLAFGAATETVSGGTIQLSAIDADWKWTDDLLIAGQDGRGVRVNFIIFEPFATANFVSIKEGTDTGPEIFPSIAAISAADSRIIYFHGTRIRPVLDYSASSLEAGATVIIQLWHTQ